jgi:hypothetical protein
MIDDVIERLAAHHLVLIHGSSGSGKSSLVRAGVLPKLARQHLRAGAPWLTCSIRPSNGPLWNLAKEFARLEGVPADVTRISEIMRLFNGREATLSAIFNSLKEARGRRLCILVDQFEELFRFEKESSREEAELFVELLVRSNILPAQRNAREISPNEVANVHVVITMRSEFLGECARFYGLAEAINQTQYLVPRMDREGLLSAIRRPAMLYGGEVNLDLAERLIANVTGREDELPLIQHGLMYMWNAAAAQAVPGQRIVLDALPVEAAGSVAKLLSSHADAILAKVTLDSESRFAVERLFRALTDLNVEGKAIRRPQAFRQLLELTQVREEKKLRDIIDLLRGEGVSFLFPYASEPILEGTIIDIGHEALIRCWTKLSDPQDGWVKREFDDGLIWRSLLVEAKGFEKNKKRVLSPATTEERWAWWQEGRWNGGWAERYGNSFSLVENLMLASRRNAVRKRLIQHAFVGVLLVISCAGVLYAVLVNRDRLELSVLSAENERALKPQEQFQECDRCPTMVVVPAGESVMGSREDEQGRTEYEGPRHRVAIAAPFAVSKFEVTFEQWDTWVAVRNGMGICRSRRQRHCVFLG